MAVFIHKFIQESGGRKPIRVYKGCTTSMQELVGIEKMLSELTTKEGWTVRPRDDQYHQFFPSARGNPLLYLTPWMVTFLESEEYTVVPVNESVVQFLSTLMKREAAEIHHELSAVEETYYERKLCELARIIGRQKELTPNYIYFDLKENQRIELSNLTDRVEDFDREVTVSV